MKIIFTGDNHIFSYDSSKLQVQLMMESIRKEKPDVVCNVGDTGEILFFNILIHKELSDNVNIIKDLFSIYPTLFVLGNHDLYSQKQFTPITAMDEYFKQMKYGIPLQIHWTDSTTHFEKGNCLFLGTIGWSDFAHPDIIMPPDYYNHRCLTIDAKHIDLSQGWLMYTKPMLEAFEKKLLLVSRSKCSNVIILTHYSVFTSQYKLNPNNEVSVFFYCYRLGEMIRHTAEENPQKEFYCVSGHGHDYNIGKWVNLTKNLHTHGLVTTHPSYSLDYIVMDV